MSSLFPFQFAFDHLKHKSHFFCRHCNSYFFCSYWFASLFCLCSFSLSDSPVRIFTFKVLFENENQRMEVSVLSNYHCCSFTTMLSSQILKRMQRNVHLSSTFIQAYKHTWTLLYIPNDDTAYTDVYIYTRRNNTIIEASSSRF